MLETRRPQARRRNATGPVLAVVLAVVAVLVSVRGTTPGSEDYQPLQAMGPAAPVPQVLRNIIVDNDNERRILRFVVSYRQSQVDIGRAYMLAHDEYGRQYRIAPRRVGVVVKQPQGFRMWFYVLPYEGSSLQFKFTSPTEPGDYLAPLVCALWDSRNPLLLDSQSGEGTVSCSNPPGFKPMG